MKDELFIVDRIEDGIVTIEKSENESLNIKSTELGIKVCEGDVLRLVNGKYIFDKEKTEELRKEAVLLQNKAFGIK